MDDHLHQALSQSSYYSPTTTITTSTTNNVSNQQEEGLKNQQEKRSVLLVPLPTSGTTGTSSLEELKLYDGLKNHVEQNLFSWDNFPIQLPNGTTVTELLSNINDSCQQDATTTPATTSSMFKDPLMEIVMGHNQVEAVKRRGNFESSNSSKNQLQLGVWLVKGREKAWEEFLDGIAFGLRFLLVYIPTLLFKSLETVRALASLILLDLLDLLFGIINKKQLSVQLIVQEERARFLVAELSCRSRVSSDLGRYVRRQIEKAGREHVVTLGMARPPIVPYRFTTPRRMSSEDNQEGIIDLRLFDRQKLSRDLLRLRSILEDKSRRSDRWFMEMREKIIHDLKNTTTTTLSKGKQEFEANSRITDEYFKNITSAILSTSSSSAENDNSEMNNLLISQARSWLLMHRAAKMVELKRKDFEATAFKEISGKFTLLSRDKLWMEKELDKLLSQWQTNHQLLGHSIAIQLLKNDTTTTVNNQQASYFLQRDHVFLKDRSSVIRLELERSQSGPATRSYTWTWPVLNKKTIKHKTSTGMIGWRLINLICLAIQLYTTTIRTCLITLPWNSNFSLRSIFNTTPYSATTTTKDAGKTHPTMTSKLRETWRRTGKEMTSPTTTTINKMLKLAIGTGLTLTYGCIWPITSLLLMTTGLIIAATAFITCPLAALLHYIAAITLIDFQHPSSSVDSQTQLFPIFKIISKFIYNLLLLAATTIAGLASPFAASIIFTYSLAKYSVHLALDTFILTYCKHFGFSQLLRQIPSTTSQHTTYQEISPTWSLLELHIYLETEELSSWKTSTQLKLSTPILKYESWCKKILYPFGLKLTDNHQSPHHHEQTPYTQLKNDLKYYTTQLEELENSRRLKLKQLQLKNKNNIRMRKQNLIKTLQKGRTLIKQFYTQRIFPHLEQKEINLFWNKLNITPADWHSLTYTIFSRIFSTEFLSPLNDDDLIVPLVKQWKYDNNLINNIFPPSSSSSTEEMHTMTTIDYKIHSPYIPLEAFNPFYQPVPQADTELCIPLPILHPAYISVIIYNRDQTDHPYDILTPLSQAIIKSIVAVQDSCVTRDDCISLNIQSSTDSSSSSSSSFSSSCDNNIDTLEYPPPPPPDDTHNNNNKNINNNDSSQSSSSSSSSSPHQNNEPSHFYSIGTSV